MIETPIGTKALVLPLTEDLLELKDSHTSAFLYFDEQLKFAILLAQDETRYDDIESEILTQVEKRLYERDAEDDYVAQGAVEITTELLSEIQFLAVFIGKLLREAFAETWVGETVENVFFVSDNVVVVCQVP